MNGHGLIADKRPVAAVRKKASGICGEAFEERFEDSCGLFGRRRLR